jgi:hypothetical protein
MKDKIFAALKQEYSNLGLGDTLLQAQAESLANLGFVTDENLEAIVKAQANGLKAIQAANDKRVGDALAKSAKEKETAAKELQAQVDELSQQIEADRKTLTKQAEELKAAQELQAKLDELKAQTEKQNAEYEKKKADLMALITGEQPQSQQEKPTAPVTPPVPQLQPVAQPEPKPEPKAQPAFDEAAFRKQLDKEWTKKLEAITTSNGSQIQQMLDANKELAAQVQALVKENTEYKAQKAAENRRNFILNKAHELGIPEWRINEGFSIADNADETAITNTLTTVSNNIRANVLPQNGVAMPTNVGVNNPDASAAIEAIASQLVQNH